MGLGPNRQRLTTLPFLLLAFLLLACIAQAPTFAQQPIALGPHGQMSPASVHFRQHPQVLAPHKPLLPRVPEAKRHPLPPAQPGSVIGGIWMTDANFKSTLYLRSIIATTAITVKPVLYLSNGTSFPLADVKLDPDGVALIDINEELAKQGISPNATLSGYVEVQYNWPWNPICASVRAADLVHSLLFHYNLQASVHGRGPKVTTGRTLSQPTTPVPASHSVEGLWWKQEPKVTGFVGLANTTSQPLTATVNVKGQQANSIAEHTVTISPHGMKLVDLTELAFTSSTSGGVTITYTGLRDDLLVEGALEDQAVGYSAMLPFIFTGGGQPDIPRMTLAELGLMTGPADPMLHFPAGTTFMPYSVLRNISDAAITVNPTVRWMASGSPQYADVPSITLAPQQSQMLDMASLLASAGLTNFAGSVNVIFDADAKAGSLLVSAGSVDKTNNYVFGVMPRGIQESASKSLSYWTTANGDDTMVTLWNPADEAQSLIFRLNYPGGHYLLPIELGPKATRMFNVSDVIRSGTPDAEGNVIPPEAHEGSAVLMGSQRKEEHILVALDAATYNVKKATCGSICFYCDGYSSAIIDPFNFDVAVDGQTQESLLLDWDDSGSETDFTGNAVWSSDNPNVMSVAGGLVSGLSQGTAVISATVADETVYNSNYCCESCLYCDSEPFSASSPGTAQVPDHLVVLADKTTTLDCSPNPSTQARQIKYEIQDISNTQIGTAALSIREIAPDPLISSCNGNTVTTTVSCTNIFLQSPPHLIGEFTDTLAPGCPNSPTNSPCGFTIPNQQWQWCPDSGSPPQSTGTVGPVNAENTLINVNGNVLGFIPGTIIPK